MNLLINLLGLGLIGFIIWWFWLSQTKAVRTDQKNELTIIVEGGTYAQDRVEVAAGTPVTLLFSRRDPSPCTDQVVFVDLGLSFDLTMDRPTHVRLPALNPGEYPFTCQMGMYRGVLQAR